MIDPTTIELPPFLDGDTVIGRLYRVLDPELDESIVELGFVHSIHGDEVGDVTIELRLPTYWCAANFSYLMASDVRRELLELPGVRSVTVRLDDHFASDAILSGVAPGKSFAEAFPDSGPDSLEQTRQLFLRKGFLTRQELLLRHLRNIGLSFEEIAALRIGDIHYDKSCCQVSRVDGRVETIGGARVASRYLERLTELGLDCSRSAPLIVEVSGTALPAKGLEAYYTRTRTTRLAMEANGSLCSALLQARSPANRPDNR